MSCTFVGSPDTVGRDLSAFVQRTGADELRIACSTFDHAAWLRSYELAASQRE